MLELFTSEGCSSCPPADAWLRHWHADARVQPLEWHVDYWDSLGWPDRFDDPRYTERQRLLAARTARDIVYTPEVSLDGREWSDWERAAMPANEPSAWQLELRVDPQNPLHAELLSRGGSTADRQAFRAYFVVTEDGLSSAVRAGENHGAVLHHDHTVRAFAGPLPLDRATATLSVPTGVDPSKSEVVAFLQNPVTGVVAQVVRQSLLQCKEEK